MAGLRSVTRKCLVVKKIIGYWEMKNNERVPKRQLILLDEDTTVTLACTDDVLNSVNEFEEYEFVIENDVANKKIKIVDVLG